MESALGLPLLVMWIGTVILTATLAIQATRFRSERDTATENEKEWTEYARQWYRYARSLEALVHERESRRTATVPLRYYRHRLRNTYSLQAKEPIE